MFKLWEPQSVQTQPTKPEPPGEGGKEKEYKVGEGGRGHKGMWEGTQEGDWGIRGTCPHLHQAGMAWQVGKNQPNLPKVCLPMSAKNGGKGEGGKGKGEVGEGGGSPTCPSKPVSNHQPVSTQAWAGG